MTVDEHKQQESERREQERKDFYDECWETWRKGGDFDADERWD